MKSALCGVALLFLGTTACTTSSDGPCCVPTEKGVPHSSVTFGCTGCSAPSPTPALPVHGCIVPACHIVRETPRASRDRSSTPVRKPVDLAVQPIVGHDGKFHVTCYDTGSITASGKRPREGMVATLSRHVPFGTAVTVDGFGTFVVEDRIGWGSDIDIYRDYCPSNFPTGDYHATFNQ